MLAPVLIRKLTLCFSIMSKTWGSPAFMVVREASMGGSGTRHWVGGSDSVPLGTGDSVPSNVFPNNWDRGLEIAFSGGTPS
jgi:hypothetical protein